VKAGPASEFEPDRVRPRLLGRMLGVAWSGTAGGRVRGRNA
jgi:hypothetical protein